MADENKIYLGDGAYAEFTGYSIVVFTSDGIIRKNEVHLEGNELKALISFAAMKGMTDLENDFL